MLKQYAKKTWTFKDKKNGLLELEQNLIKLKDKEAKIEREIG